MALGYKDKGNKNQSLWQKHMFIIKLQYLSHEIIETNIKN